MRSIKTIEEKAGDLVLTLTEGNADLPLMLTDYHLIIQPKGGTENPNAAIRHRAPTSTRPWPACAPPSRRMPKTGARIEALSIWSRSSS